MCGQEGVSSMGERRAERSMCLKTQEDVPVCAYKQCKDVYARLRVKVYARCTSKDVPV